MSSISLLALWTTFIAVQGNDANALREELVHIAETQLVPAGLFVDRDRAWLGVSRPLPVAQELEVQVPWSVRDDGAPPVLPLEFAVRARGTSDQPIQVTLSVTLRRDVLVASRRLRKGSALRCDDLSVERRDIRRMPQHALLAPCEIASGSVVQRDIAARDVLRNLDVGPALDVVAGMPVRLSVATSGIQVMTTAVALADARVGDRVDVRLQRPTRRLQVRVIGPGSVELAEGTR
jgi:flagella basal body P-ring formation protein FlgA